MRLSGVGDRHRCSRSYKSAATSTKPASDWFDAAAAPNDRQKRTIVRLNDSFATITPNPLQTALG
jgi:hypothetical protein